MSAEKQTAAAPAEPLTLERYSRTVAQVATIHLFARASEAPEEVLTGALLVEAGEVAGARMDEHRRDEFLDVAIVALRAYEALS